VTLTKKTATMADRTVSSSLAMKATLSSSTNLVTTHTQSEREIEAACLCAALEGDVHPLHASRWHCALVFHVLDEVEVSPPSALRQPTTKADASTHIAHRPQSHRARARPASTITPSWPHAHGMRGWIRGDMDMDMNMDMDMDMPHHMA
jgi:hypothetical protein